MPESATDSAARLAEEEFKRWLDEKGYPYLYINQQPDSFPTFFGRYGLKRPDFLVLVQNFGLIAVDVKVWDPGYCHTYRFLDEEGEVQKYLRFERIARIPVWFVFARPTDGFDVWYWIPLSRVLELAVRTSTRSSGPFRQVAAGDCILLQRQDGLGRLLDQINPGA